MADITRWLTRLRKEATDTMKNRDAPVLCRQGCLNVAKEILWTAHNVRNSRYRDELKNFLIVLNGLSVEWEDTEALCIMALDDYYSQLRTYGLHTSSTLADYLKGIALDKCSDVAETCETLLEAAEPGTAPPQRRTKREVRSLLRIVATGSPA